ncbi:hypothetical protein K9N68_03240 [Kovacikia minuta CCNUW1]|uniref:hypothetical protein n=1 Tax=Kovacikia minuta TaxID=2931930 RepID=UPI001CC96F77|nr:hypothetical protein [Kovacikia minuta]UBF27009.1 hypothetical protein K9N68_03240 [Kovacikia minuta CCNUW1]
MKQIAGIGKGILNLGRAYWHWANQIADNHSVSLLRLNEMVRKGQFKTLEDAERATRRTIRVALFIFPIVFLAILIWSAIPKSTNHLVVVQTTPISSPPLSGKEITAKVQPQTKTKPTEQPLPESIAKSERFRQKFYEEVSELTGKFDVRAKYALQTVQSWETQPDGVELSYRYSCEDLIQFKGDAIAAAQSAYGANQFSIPLDQLQVYYTAKFTAAKYVGCQ